MANVTWFSESSNDWSQKELTESNLHLNDIFIPIEADSLCTDTFASAWYKNVDFCPWEATIRPFKVRFSLPVFLTRPCRFPNALRFIRPDVVKFECVPKLSFRPQISSATLAPIRSPLGSRLEQVCLLGLRHVHA